MIAKKLTKQWASTKLFAYEARYGGMEASGSILLDGPADREAYLDCF